MSLTGTTQAESHRRWATDLAWRTEDVVAVVNRIEVQVPELVDRDELSGRTTAAFAPRQEGRPPRATTTPTGRRGAKMNAFRLAVDAGYEVDRDEDGWPTAPPNPVEALHQLARSRE